LGVAPIRRGFKDIPQHRKVNRPRALGQATVLYRVHPLLDLDGVNLVERHITERWQDVLVDCVLLRVPAGLHAAERRLFVSLSQVLE
jgi:hypothetical protein